MTDLFKNFANAIRERLGKTKQEQPDLSKGKEEVFEDQIKINADKKARQDADRTAAAQDLATRTQRGSRNYSDKQVKKQPADRKGLRVIKSDLVKALMDSGFTQSARDLSIWDHKDDNAYAMEKSLLKSNYGPKNMGLYNPQDNQKRKASNTGESLKDIGKNQNLKQYTTSKASMQAASEKSAAKEQRKKTKASTRTMKDFSPEELQAMTDKANKPK